MRRSDTDTKDIRDEEKKLRDEESSINGTEGLIGNLDISYFSTESLRAHKSTSLLTTSESFIERRGAPDDEVSNLVLMRKSVNKKSLLEQVTTDYDLEAECEGLSDRSEWFSIVSTYEPRN